MRKVGVEHAKPGMRLAEHIYNEAGVIRVQAGTALTDVLVTRLAEFGVAEVAIEDPRVDDLSVVESVPRAVITQGREILRALHENLRAAGAVEKTSLPFDDLLGLVHSIEEGLASAGQGTVEITPVARVEDCPYLNPINAAALAMFVTEKAGLPKRVVDVGLGALLCDVGMVFAEEQEKHPDYSLRVLRQDARFSAYSRAIVFQHHERHDGSGFPRGIAGNDIDPLARIVSVADTYCSIISEGNPMGERLSRQEAFDYVTSTAGFEFDRTTVMGVMQYVAPYPVGTMVKLNGGEKGVVTRVYKGLTTRPTVRVFYEADGSEALQMREIVLAAAENQTVLVTEVLRD
ncbi:MAG: HD domain-containing phosphohydrolase [Clostridia bacterium]|nr:HD domain-containing phosphohydrolase [Clostridia bacterium]